MLTVECSLDNTEQKFADLSGNQLPISFKRLSFTGNVGDIHASQGLDWAFSSLSHYYILTKYNLKKGLN